MDWIQINVDRRAPPAAEPTVGAHAPAVRLYQYAVLLAVPILFLLLFPTPLMPLGLGGVVLLFSLRWLAFGSPVPETRINLPLLVFFAAVVFGLLRAPDLAITSLRAARLLAGAVTFFLVVDYADHPSRVWKVAAALVVLGIVTVVFAPFVTTSSTEKLFDVSFLLNERIPHLWDVSNPNMVGGTLAALIPLALALAFGEVRALRPLGIFALVPSLGMLLLLQARGAILAAVGGMTLFAVLMNRWFLAVVPILILLALVLNNSIVRLVPDQRRGVRRNS